MKIREKQKQQKIIYEYKLTCLTCLNCSSKLHPLFCCDELDVSLDVDEFEPDVDGKNKIQLII